MELAAKPPRSNFINGLWEATAFLGPILLFGYGSLSRVIAFFDTQSLATLVSAAGFIALTSVFGGWRGQRGARHGTARRQNWPAVQRPERGKRLTAR